MTIYMGFDGTLSVAGCSAFRNLKLTISGTEVDITTNKDEGYKKYAKGLIDYSVTADLDTSDGNASGIIAALESRTPTSCSVSIGGVSKTFTCLVFGGDIGGTLDDAVWIPITVRPTRAGSGGGGDDSSSTPNT